jgi:hypothetical protein
MSAIAGDHAETAPTGLLTRARLKWLAYATVGGLIAFVGARYGYEYWTVGRFIESTDDAYAGGNVTPISPHVPGFVAEILVGDNEYVRAGHRSSVSTTAIFALRPTARLQSSRPVRRRSTASGANRRCNKQRSARRRRTSTPRLRRRRSPSKTTKGIGTWRRPPPDRGKIRSGRRRSTWRPRPA